MGSDRAILAVGDGDQCPGIVYATGFVATDPVVYLQHGRRRCLIVPSMELGRARRTARGVCVRSPEQVGLNRRQRRRLEWWVRGLLRAEGLRRVAVARDFPLGLARALEKAGVRLILAGEDLFPRRAVKRSAECDRIAESQRAAVEAMRLAIEMLRVSKADGRGFLVWRGERLCSETVQAEVAAFLARRRCIARDTIVAGGPQASDPHERGSGPLRAGETVVLDIFPRHAVHGYWGDLSRTVVKGRATETQRRMYRAVRAAQRRALDALKAGVKGCKVHRAAAEELARRGFHTGERDGRPEGFIHGTGHGVGLEVHEAPVLGMAETRLRSGNVVTIEPGLYYREHGGVRIEDTVVVTRAGWRPLARCEYPFEL